MTTATDIAEAQLKMPVQTRPGRRAPPAPSHAQAPHRDAGQCIVTLVCLWILWLGVKGAYGWLVTRAVTEGGAQACKVGHGACWPFYAAKLRFMIFGVYPYDEHWRVRSRWSCSSARSGSR